MAYDLQLGQSSRHVSGQYAYLLVSGDTVYYGNDVSVSASYNLGSLTPGQYLDQPGPAYLVSAGTSYIRQVDRATVSDASIVRPLDGGVPTYDAAERTFRFKAGDSAVDVRDYGAVGDGVTDDSAAIQAAIDATAGAGSVLIPAGTYLLDTPLRLPIAATGFELFGDGMPTLLLGTGVFRAIDCQATAAGQTFSNITVRNITVDADNQPLVDTPVGAEPHSQWHSHTLIGNLMPPPSGYSGSIFAYGGYARISVENMLIENCHTVNVPTTEPGDITGDWTRQNIGFFSYHETVSETLARFDNITVRGCSFDGGNVGVTILASGGGSGNPLVNHANERIVIEDCYHDTGIQPAASFIGAHVQLGLQCIPGTMTVRNFTGIGSQDVGIEIDNPASAEIINCKMVDFWLAGYFVRNFGVKASDYPDNSIVIRDCIAKHTSAATILSSGYYIEGGTVGEDDFGTVIIDGCSYINESALWDAPACKGTAVQSAGPVLDLTVSNFTAKALSVNATSGTTTATFIYVNPGAAPETRLTLNNVYLERAGTASANVGGSLIDMASSFASHIELNARNVVIVDNIASAAADQARWLINGLTGFAVDGVIDGYRAAGTRDGGTKGDLNIGATSALTIAKGLVLRNIDTADSGSTTPVVFNYPTNAENVTIARDGDSPSAITLASAAALAIPDRGEFFVVSGTTDITSITGDIWNGRVITLLFIDTLTLIDGGNLVIAGNFVANNADTITLGASGGNFFEISRSVN